MKKLLVIRPLSESGMYVPTNEYTSIVIEHTKKCTREVISKQYKVDLENVSVFIFNNAGGVKEQIEELNTLNRLISEKYDEVLFIGHCINDKFHYASVKCIDVNPKVKFSISDNLGSSTYDCHLGFCQTVQAYPGAPQVPVRQFAIPRPWPVQRCSDDDDEL